MPKTDGVHRTNCNIYVSGCSRSTFVVWTASTDIGNLCPIELPQTSAKPGRSDPRILELCLGWWRKEEVGDLSLTSCSGFTEANNQVSLFDLLGVYVGLIT